MKRFLSVFAVAIALTAAFAFRAEKRVVITYAIGSETATSYTLVEQLDGEVIGTDYLCNSQPAVKCTATSPASQAEISTFPHVIAKPAPAGWTLSSGSSKFQDLNPTDGD